MLSAIRARDPELVGNVMDLLLGGEGLPEDGISCDEFAAIVYVVAAFRALKSASEDGADEFSATDIVKIMTKFPDQYPPPLLDGPWLGAARGTMSDVVANDDVSDGEELPEGESAADLDGVRVKMDINKIIVEFITTSRNVMHIHKLEAWASTSVSTLDGANEIVAAEVDDYIRGHGEVWTFKENEVVRDEQGTATELQNENGESGKQ